MTARKGPTVSVRVDQGWPTLEANLASLKKGARNRIIKGSLGKALRSEVRDEVKRSYRAMAKGAPPRRGRPKKGAKRKRYVSMTRAIASGLKVKAMKRSRVKVGWFLYPPTRAILEKKSKGRYKASYKGYPPAHIEFGAKWRGVRAFKPMRKAILRTKDRFFRRFARLAIRGVILELRKNKGAK